MDKKHISMLNQLSLDLFCVIDERGYIVDINDSFLHQLEWSREEAVGSKIFNFVPTYEHGKLTSLFQKMLKSKETEEINCHFLKKSGEALPYRSNCFFDADSSLIYTASIKTYSIEDRMVLNQSIVKFEDSGQLTEVQAIAKIGSWQYAIENKKISWTPQMYKLLGRDPRKGEPELETYKEIVFEEDYDFWIETFSKCIQDGEPYVMTYRVYNPFMGIVWVESRGRGVFDEDGENLIGVRGTIQDVTYLKLKEARLQAAIKEAKRLSKTKDMFFANMSHEIRTPMNGILGMTELLLQTKLGKLQKEYIEIIKNCGESLLEIINDVLDLSKVESGLLKVNKKKFSLNEMLKSLYPLFKSLAQEKNVKLVFNIDPNLENFYENDELKLRQIVTNLIGNALKFTTEGEVVLSVRLIDAYESYHFAQFEVKDSGIGINKKEIGNQIFEPFVQEHREENRDIKGTGLGLSISSQLVELLGGKIEYDSILGTGTTFKFILSMDLVDKEESVNAVAETRPLLNESPTKILVVEDNEINRLIIQKFLERLNLECQIAPSGEEALALLKKEEFDLIFMDLKMPGLSGFETTEKINKLKLSKKPKIVALTANAFEEDREKCFELGMYDFLSKPISFELLQNLIEKFRYSD